MLGETIKKNLIIAAMVAAMIAAATTSFAGAGSEQDPEITDSLGDATIGGVDIAKGWFGEETQTSLSIHLMIADLENAGPFGTPGNENDPTFRVWFVFEPTNVTYFAEASKSMSFGEQYKLYCVEFENNYPKTAHFLADMRGEWNTSAKQVVLTVEKERINVSKIEGGAPVQDSTKTPKVGDRIISPSGEAIMWRWMGGGSPPSVLGKDSTSPGRAYTFSVAPTSAAPTAETGGFSILIVGLIVAVLIATVGVVIALRKRKVGTPPP